MYFSFSGGGNIAAWGIISFETGLTHLRVESKISSPYHPCEVYLPFTYIYHKNQPNVGNIPVPWMVWDLFSTIYHEVWLTLGPQAKSVSRRPAAGQGENACDKHL